MRSIIKTIVVISLILLVGCMSKKEKREQTWKTIYIEKELEIMPDMLFPEMIDNHVYICGEKPLLEKNSFACIAATEFSFGTLTEDFRIIITPVKKGFANDAIGEFDANEKGSMMWAKMGYCGFLAINTLDKDTVDFVPSVALLRGTAYNEVYRTYVTDLPGNVLLFC